MTLRWSASFAVAGFTAVALASFIALEVQDELQTQELIAQAAVPAAAAAAAAAQGAVQAAPDTRDKALPPSPKAGYYAELRSKLQWVQTRMGGTMLLTPDMNSRMILAKSAARHAGLSEVGLSFKDVYGIIYAETSWVPRMGASKNGTPNLGIAQFEPATARALGLTNPEDPVEAIHVAAVHMKQPTSVRRSCVKASRSTTTCPPRAATPGTARTPRSFRAKRSCTSPTHAAARLKPHSSMRASAWPR